MSVWTMLLGLVRRIVRSLKRAVGEILGTIFTGIAGVSVIVALVAIPLLLVGGIGLLFDHGSS